MKFLKFFVTPFHSESSAIALVVTIGVESVLGGSDLATTSQDQSFKAHYISKIYCNIAFVYRNIT